MGDALLQGLLLGFGQHNSYLFYWKHFDTPKSCQSFCEKLVCKLNKDTIKGSVTFTINNFNIPSFMSFDDIDPVVEKYKDERVNIKKIYKNEDFLEITLKKLIES